MYKAIKTGFPSENGQYHGFEDDEKKNNNNNSNILATKDSSHCNLTTSKLCNESADIPKNTTVTEISHKLLKYFTYPWIYLK